MGDCTNCSHEHERHLFGGACFYCDCKRDTYDTSTLVYFKPRAVKQSRNGDKSGKKPEAPRLGNQ